MPYGFRSINDFGSFQIDDTYCNLAFVAKGTFTPSAQGTLIGPGPSKQFSISIAGESPIILARSSDWNTYVSMMGASNSGGIWTFTLEASQSAPGVITWYIFDVPPDPGLGGYGIRVRRADTKITFHSAHKYLRVVNFVPLPAINDYPYFQQAYPAVGGLGMDLAACFTDPGAVGTFIVQPATPPTVVYQTPMMSFSLNASTANVLPRARINYPVVPGSSIQNWTTAPKGILFADVTGY